MFYFFTIINAIVMNIIFFIIVTIFKKIFIGV